jgi:hypothetical protein
MCLRALGRKSGCAAQLGSRNQKEFARRFGHAVKSIREPSDDAVVDGEIVALDEQGRPSFNLLQGFGAPSETVIYIFDLLMFRARMCASQRTSGNLQIAPGHHQVFGNVRFFSPSPNAHESKQASRQQPSPNFYFARRGRAIKLHLSAHRCGSATSQRRSVNRRQ